MTVVAICLVAVFSVFILYTDYILATGNCHLRGFMKCDIALHVRYLYDLCQNNLHDICKTFVCPMKENQICFCI